MSSIFKSLNKAHAISEEIKFAKIVIPTNFKVAILDKPKTIATAGLNAVKQMLPTAPIPTRTDAPIASPKAVKVR